MRLGGVCLRGALRGPALAIALGIALATSSAHAQTEPSAEDRSAAGEAYDRGTAAFLAHEYARAATLFETAFHLAPSAPALIQAIRALEHSSDGALRAGTLALRLEAQYGSDRQAARQARTTLHTASGRFLRVDVSCDATCTVELDGRVEDYTSFFVDPASPHAVRASFDTGIAPTQATAAAAGETQAIAFARPPEPPPPVVEVAVAVVAPPIEEIPPPAPPPPSGGLHPAVFITVAGLTAVAGGILIWSAVDMYGGVPAYQMNPTAAALQDGQSREVRTDVMWGVTGGLAAASVVLAIVTDWSGGGGGGGTRESETPTVSFMGLPGGGALVVDGSF